MYINKYMGRHICFRNGLSIGFSWVHCNGETSKRSALIAGYHPSTSITWLWSIYWNKPDKLLIMPRFSKFSPPSDQLGGMSVMLPIVGGFNYSWQKPVRRI